MTTRNVAFSVAYKQLHEELSRLLYEEDPAGMGATIDAPRDEYDGEAARLASDLRNVRAREDIEVHLVRTFGSSSEALVLAIERAMAKFRLKIETAKHTLSND